MCNDISLKKLNLRHYNFFNLRRTFLGEEKYGDQLTFHWHPLKLSGYGYKDRIREINKPPICL